MSSPLIWASIADKLLGVLEKFLDPAQYKIVRMKQMHRALDWAEKEFDLMDEMLNLVPDEKIKKLHDRNKKYFLKYN
jgi:hypothetical protein